MSVQNKIGPVDLLSLNQADRLKYEFASAPSEGAGVQSDGEEQDGLRHLLERHCQRGAGPPE